MIDPVSTNPMDVMSALSLADARTGAEALRRGAASNRIEAGAAAQPDIDELLNQFQGVLWKELAKAMRATVPENALYGQSTGEEIFQSMLDEEYVNVVGEKNGSLGLTEALKWQLGLTESVPKAEPRPVAELASAPAEPAFPPAAISAPVAASVEELPQIDLEAPVPLFGPVTLPVSDPNLPAKR
jgi:Rod binding domain-containing protein